MSSREVSTQTTLQKIGPQLLSGYPAPHAHTWRESESSSVGNFFLLTAVQTVFCTDLYAQETQILQAPNNLSSVQRPVDRRHHPLSSCYTSPHEEVAARGNLGSLWLVNMQNDATDGNGTNDARNSERDDDTRLSSSGEVYRSGYEALPFPETSPSDENPHAFTPTSSLMDCSSDDSAVLRSPVEAEEHTQPENIFVTNLVPAASTLAAAENEDVDADRSIRPGLQVSDHHTHDLASSCTTGTEAQGTSSVASCGPQRKDLAEEDDSQQQRSEERKQQLQQKVRELREENRRLRTRQMCRQCRSRPISLTLLPCGHLCLCTECGPSLDHCPLCRKVILADVRTYL